MKGRAKIMKIFIASHGNLSIGILDSLQMITGDSKNIQALQLKRGGDPQKIAQRIENEIQENATEHFLIFTDLKGGSVHNAMIRLCNYENVSVISGFNLSMILDVVFLTNQVDDSAIQEVIAVGKDGIELFNKTILTNLLNG